MVIAVGDTLPDTTVYRFGAEGPEALQLSSVLGSPRTVIFGLPGAFTGTCDAQHLPSFIRTKDAFAEKGVTSICCISVNDPFVMHAWGERSGANAAGIHMLGDAASEFTRAIDMEFSAPQVGLLHRTKRFSMAVEGNKVIHLNIEDNPGMCDLTAGESLLAAL
ncbi:redoxin family protein [Halovulum sp. GXIMD14793]